MLIHAGAVLSGAARRNATRVYFALDIHKIMALCDCRRSARDDDVTLSGVTRASPLSQ